MLFKVYDEFNERWIDGSKVVLFDNKVYENVRCFEDGIWLDKPILLMHTDFFDTANKPIFELDVVSFDVRYEPFLNERGVVTKQLGEWWVFTDSKKRYKLKTVVDEFYALKIEGSHYDN